MESYYLLRENRESGPYTAKDLKAKGLFSTDLLWIEGESTCWKHPAEIPALVAYIREPEPRPRKSVKKASVTVATASTIAETHSSKDPLSSTSGHAAFSEPVLFDETPDAAPSFEELKKKYSRKVPRKKLLHHTLNFGANLVGLVTFVMGVSMAAFMIKKAVDNIEWEPPEYATSEAHEITSEKLPQSTSSHAAMSAVPALPLVKSSETTVDTAKKQEVALVKKEPKKSIVKTDTLVQAAEKKATDDVVKAKTESSDTVKEVAETKAPEEKAEKVASKPDLQLGVNKYNVGLFGGISNLELSVTNASSQPVDKAVVEVEYIKSNGKVVGSKTVEVNSIAPGSTRKIQVPDNGRGTSVRYRVLNM